MGAQASQIVKEESENGHSATGVQRSKVDVNIEMFPDDDSSRCSSHAESPCGRCRVGTYSDLSNPTRDENTFTPHHRYLHISAKVKSGSSPILDKLGCLGKRRVKNDDLHVNHPHEPHGHRHRRRQLGVPGGGGGGGTHAGDSGEEREEFPRSPAVIRRRRLLELEAERPRLTEEQIVTISCTWTALQGDLDNVGKDMFLRLFEAYPDVRGAFGPFKSMSPDDQRYNQELRAHGLRVLRTVDVVVSMKDNHEAAVSHLHELGRRHITFNAKVDYMDIVGQQFLFAIEPVLKDRWNSDVEQAWADLFRFVTHVMREAMML